MRDGLLVTARRSLRRRERNAESAGLTDESVCPTLMRKRLRLPTDFFPASNGRGSELKIQEYRLAAVHQKVREHQAHGVHGRPAAGGREAGVPENGRAQR